VNTYLQGTCPECGFAQQFGCELGGQIVQCRYLPCGAYLRLKEDGRLLLSFRPMNKFPVIEPDSPKDTGASRPTIPQYDMQPSPNGEQWEIRPSAELINNKFSESAEGAGCTFVVACLCLFSPLLGFLDLEDNVLEYVGLSVIGCLSLFGAVVLLRDASLCNRRRNLPLIIDRSGRISYGGEDVCPAGTHRPVSFSHVQTDECDEAPAEDYYVVRIPTVTLPAPYFDRITFHDKCEAYAFARVLEYGSRM